MEEIRRKQAEAEEKATRRKQVQQANFYEEFVSSCILLDFLSHSPTMRTTFLMR